MLRYTIIIGLAVALSAGSILAQAKAPDAEKPATVKADKPVDNETPVKNASAKHTVTVVSVSGIAEQRSAREENAKWTAIKAGDVLDEMTLVRTGLGGKVVLKLSNRGLVTVKSGTKIGIASFSQQDKMVKTRLGLKYGAIRAKVDSTQGANDFRVRTAVGTLAATGTGGDMAQWGDFAFQAKGTHGSWRLVIAKSVRSIKPGESTNKNMSKPLATLLMKNGVNMGDPHGGLTSSELKNLILNGGGRGIIGFGNTKGSGAPKLVSPQTIPLGLPTPYIRPIVPAPPAPLDNNDSNPASDHERIRYR